MLNALHAVRAMCHVAHAVGSALERRLVAVVDPEHSTLASLVRSLRERETNAEGLVSVLNDLLREVQSFNSSSASWDKPGEEITPGFVDILGHLAPHSTFVSTCLALQVAKELPTDLKSPALERMQTILAEPRRTLTRLLSVSDRLAALVRSLKALRDTQRLVTQSEAREACMAEVVLTPCVYPGTRLQHSWLVACPAVPHIADCPPRLSRWWLPWPKPSIAWR